MPGDEIEAVYVHEDEYDPVTCVTAGELRASGFPVPNDIPDCGWIPRVSVHVADVTVGEVTDGGDGRLNIAMEIRYSEPFQWLVADFDVEGSA